MNIRNRNIFRITRFILLRVPYLFRLASQFRKPSKRILIIKTDAIGDYILFRNFIELVHSSDKFKDYEIDLLGNRLWQDITLEYDSQFLTKTFFINSDEICNYPWLTLKTGLKLFKRNYEQVLQPTYSRTLISDGLAGLATGKYTIGFLSDNEGISKRYKTQTDKFYSVKMLLPPDLDFEFYRTTFFFETVLEKKIAPGKPVLKPCKDKNNNVIIFPGAGSAKREWRIENYLAIATLILERTNNSLILAGGKGDLAHSDFLVSNLNNNSRVKNLIAKTTLPQLIDLIANAACVISNETSAVHIAAACDTPSVCIQGGGHYNRFTPYPYDSDANPVCVFEPMPCFNCNWICSLPHEKADPFPCISKIEIEDVWEIVSKLLNSRNYYG